MALPEEQLTKDKLSATLLIRRKKINELSEILKFLKCLIYSKVLQHCELKSTVIETAQSLIHKANWVLKLESRFLHGQSALYPTGEAH